MAQVEDSAKYRTNEEVWWFDRGLVADNWRPQQHLFSCKNNVVMDNGILQMTLAVPEGYVTGISFNGVDNLLETLNEESNRGYFDAVWDAPGLCGTPPGCTDWLLGTRFEIIHESEDQTEISFSSKWDPESWTSNASYPRLAINVDRRYVMQRGVSGFYSYAILEREEGWPESNIYQIRAVYKLDRDRFHYMAVSDERQRIMPMPQDRDSGHPLAFKEAVLLTNPINTSLRGEVDDKYQYSCEDRYNKMHGWVCFDPSVGLWMITPSNEYRTAGPLKQDLTSHTGPITLAMFHSNHYAGLDLIMSFNQGEAWKKVYGPYLLYLNSASNDASVLWEDAKRQMMEETSKWPYEFVASEDFPKSSQRGSVTGRLLGYQFWRRADHIGRFVIDGIREGDYNLYAFVPGFIGDYMYEHVISVVSGTKLELGYLIFDPPRSGPTLWEIGRPDRSAAEFYIPNPSPVLLNKLYVHKIHEKFRQYGLWERYADLYPEHDLVYDIESSDYHTDWFFAQVTRRGENMSYQPTTWQLIFPLENLDPLAIYTMRIALASATLSQLQVRVNDPNLLIPHFNTSVIGKDNAIARHGIHGLYWLFNIELLGSWFQIGSNTIYLTQTKCTTPFQGVMYDYIRLEGPAYRES
ncbi:hypothetical protein V2J09_010716 [Rumex salicifolius]